MRSKEGNVRETAYVFLLNRTFQTDAIATRELRKE